TVKIGTDVSLVRIFQLFGGDVVGRADDGSIARQRRQRIFAEVARLVQPGGAHVEDLDPRPRRQYEALSGRGHADTGGDDHEVGWLDIAVHQRLLDSVLQTQGGLTDEIAGQGDGQRAVVVHQRL